MSPRRIVQISLWQILLAFAAVTGAFILATVIATNASNQAHELAIQNQRTLQRADRIRSELVRKIHAQDIVNCRRVHINNRDLRLSIRRSLRQTEAALRGPTAKLPGVADLFRKGIRESRRLLRDLRGADCLHVPPLTPPPVKAVP